MNSRNKLCNIVFRTLASFSIGTAVCACDDPSSTSHAVKKPAVITSTTQPVGKIISAVVMPARPLTVMTIDGQTVPFPSARMAVIGHNCGLTVRLCSDDPPEAIEPGYAGNSFILDMQLGCERTQELPATTWDYKPSDKDDAISGFFVNGYKNGLRPHSVHVAFQKANGELLVYISGKFLRNDPQNPGAPPESVDVNGCVHVDRISE